MSPGSLVSALHRLYKPCGVLDAEQLATHTAKRSGVQFYEAIHQTPALIMEKGGWTDAHSFMKYRSLCNRPEQRYAYTHTASWYQRIVYCSLMVGDARSRWGVMKNCSTGG